LIYNLSPGGQGLLIIGRKEINQLLRGEPVGAPDGNFLVCWVPDMAWTEKEFRAMVQMGKGKIDPKVMAYIMAEALKQPEVLESEIVNPEAVRRKNIIKLGGE
jgi:hypothetical protein